VIALAGNRGYSGGINAGIRQALADGASHVLLANSDVVVAPDTIALLEGALAGPDGAAVAGPLVVPRTDPGTIASLGMRFSRSSGRMRHFGFGQPRASVPPRIRVVDGVSGCLMLVRRDVFDRVGLFDESYFFGFEDLEFCLRARDAGFPTVCTAHAVAFHEGSVSIGARSPRRVYFAARNHLKLSAARGPHGVRLAARQAAVIAFNAAYVVGSRQVPLLPGLLALGRGVRHHFARRYGSD
jgi:GT2 family glycosyltransferase